MRGQPTIWTQNEDKPEEEYQQSIKRLQYANTRELKNLQQIIPDQSNFLHVVVYMVLIVLLVSINIVWLIPQFMLHNGVSIKYPTSLPLIISLVLSFLLIGRSFLNPGKRRQNDKSKNDFQKRNNSSGGIILDIFLLVLIVTVMSAWFFPNIFNQYALILVSTMVFLLLIKFISAMMATNLSLQRLRPAATSSLDKWQYMIEYRLQSTMFQLVGLTILSLTIFALVEPEVLVQWLAVVIMPWHRILAIVVISYLSSFSIPVYQGKSTKLEFRLLDFRWKSTYAIQIRAALQSPRFVTLLRNMPHLTLYQLNDLNKETTTLIITATRRFLPGAIIPSKLVKLLNSVLTSSKIIYFPVSIPDIRFQRFQFLTSHKLFLQLDQLIRQLRHNKARGQLITVIRKDHERIDPAALGIETLYDIYVGYISPEPEAWQGPMHMISANVSYRPRLFHAMYRSAPEQWLNLVNLFRFPGLSWWVEWRAKNISYGRKAEQAFSFPRYDTLSDEIYQFQSPDLHIQFRYAFGNLVQQGISTKPIGIPIKDLAQGGIIAGAIGTGKTTLRLHLMRLVRAHGLRVVDFDLKGDVTRYTRMVEDGKVVIPGRNFHLNPFACPDGFSSREYANILLQSFAETIPAGEDLSPPQMHLLTRAIYKTVEERGNSRQFFKNLYIIGSTEQQLIDNKQENTAQAVITRFNWMKTVMHDIFWYPKSSLLITDYASTSLYFDLSELNILASKVQIRFLINLIMARIMATMRQRRISELRDVIFLDETQILMPRRDKSRELTKLEQTVTTLRYKGVSVIATGVSAAMMSPVLLDVGFVAQFRSESDSLLRALAIHDDEDASKLVSQLPAYHALIRSGSTGSRPVMVKTREFVMQEAIPPVQSTKLVPLKDFELDFDNIWVARLDAAISADLTTTGYQRVEIKRLAQQYLQSLSLTFDYSTLNLETLLIAARDDIVEQLGNKAQHPIVGRFPVDFLLFFLHEVLYGLIRQHRFDNQLNIIAKNLEAIIHQLKTKISALTKHLVPPQHQDQLYLLRGYLMQIEEMQQLNRADTIAATVEIASQFEKLAAQLNIDPVGMAMKVQLLYDMGFLELEQVELLQKFNQHIRNRVVHGSYRAKSSDLRLIYDAGQLVVQLWGHYRQFDDDMAANFAI